MTKTAPDQEAMKFEMQTLQEHVRQLEAQMDDTEKNSAAELALLSKQLNQARDTNRALAEANRQLLSSENSQDATAKAQAEGLAEANNALKTQNASLEQDMTALRAENARLKDIAAAADRALDSRIARLQQENAAMETRLRLAQATLDQIAATTRFMNGASSPAPRRPEAPPVSVALPPATESTKA